MALPHLSTEQKLNNMKSNNGVKAWSAIHDDLQQRLYNERDKLKQLNSQLGQTLLVAEAGDAQAQASCVNLRNDIAATERSIADIQIAYDAAVTAAEQSETSRNAESHRKSQIRLKNLLDDLKKASNTLDRTLTTVANQYEKVSGITEDIHALMRDFKVVKHSSSQLKDAINKPLKNFPSALTSKLPPNTGLPRLAFHTEALAMSDMVADFDHIAQFLVLEVRLDG